MDFERLLKADAREKRMARGGVAVAKKRPGSLVMPGDLRGRSREPPYSWLTAEAIVKVDILSGKILIYRWPLEF